MKHRSIIKKYKSQLKIQQMAFMLMAVFIFFILAGLFYILSQSHNIKRTAELKDQKRAIELVNNLADSAEFSCGNYCIDADRAVVLGNRAVYKNLWKVSSIKIRTSSNSSKDTVCTKANYPKCNLIVVYDKKVGETTVYSYVSVCKRVKEKEYVEYRCDIGKFIIGYETKEG